SKDRAVCPNFAAPVVKNCAWTCVSEIPKEPERTEPEQGFANATVAAPSCDLYDLLSWELVRTESNGRLQPRPKRRKLRSYRLAVTLWPRLPTSHVLGSN